MRFDGGWVKLHRNLEEHWVGKDGIALAVFAKLLIMANWRDGKKFIRGEEVTIIKRGQVLTSTRELSELLGFDRTSVERRLNAMTSDGMVAQQVSQRGRIITICNYDKYQSFEKDGEPLNSHSTATEQPLNSHSTATEPASIEEVKNLKKVKKGRNRASVEAALSAQEIAIATKWLEYSKREMPWKSEDPKWNIEEWAHALVELKKKTDLNDEGLERVLEFVSNDHFWAKNAVSPKMLLAKSKSNGQRKIDNILVNLRTKADRNNLKLAKWLEEEKNKAPDPSIPEGHLF